MAPISIADSCLLFPESGWVGYKHWCGQTALLTVTAEVYDLPSQYSQYNGTRTFLFSLEFGPTADDSYAKPEVMACCKPYDDEVDLWDQPHQGACFHDLVIDDLANWVAANQQECYEEFWWISGAVTADLDGHYDTFPAHTWSLPSSANTKNVKDIGLELSAAWINEAYLPANPNDWAICESNEDNDEITFVMADPSLGLTYELLEGDLELTGQYQSTNYSASALLDSVDEGCSVCSLMIYSPPWGSGNPITLEALVLDSLEPSSVQWSPSTLVGVDRFRITLFRRRRSVSPMTHRTISG